MELTVHEVKGVKVETMVFDGAGGFVTKSIIVLDVYGKELITLKLFGETKEDLKLSIGEGCSIL